MGTHRGIIISPRGNRWQCRVARPGLDSYDTRTFDGKDEAAAWGKRRRAELILDPHAARRPKRLEKATLDTAAIGERLAQRQALDGISPGHLSNMASMVRQIAGKVPDLASPTARDAIRDWLDAKKLAPRTYNRHLAQLERLVRFARDEGYIVAEADPLRGLENRWVPNDIKEQFWVRLFMQPTVRADARTIPITGTTIATSSAMIEITISISTRLKPARLRSGAAVGMGRSCGTRPPVHVSHLSVLVNYR